MKTRLFMIVGLMILNFGYSQKKDLWKKIPIQKKESASSYSTINVSSNNSYSLDLETLKKLLLLAPNRSKSKENSNIIISFPNYQGNLKKYRILKTNTLHPDLAKKFPSIRSYIGTEIGNRLNTIRISISDTEFHGMILSIGSPTVYIDPVTVKKDKYAVYTKEDMTYKKESKCLYNSNTEEKTLPSNSNNHQKNANDGTLRKYRIAIACTDEYAQFHISNQNIPSGATDAIKKAAVLSAMNTTIVRVNAVYERDLGITFEIVADNTKIIFLDQNSNTLDNNNASTLINQSQEICDSEIGNANYDIGHTFSTGAGGFAGFEVVCKNDTKGRGVTGLSNPIGDPYDIDFVAHEIGHQFGGDHTFNNSCDFNINPATAVEPGSGSTIMAYAGICPPNIQNKSDDHFHAISIEQMWTYISSTSCASNTVTLNNAPVANAGNDFTIPKSTPFILKGSATDSNADELTYNWEQMDNESATMPPVSTSTFGPAFRSLPSTTSSERYMPMLPTVISGATSNTWEVVPSVARIMNFRLTVRDNQLGIGNSDSDDMVLTVNGTAGPFLVTTPNTNVNWISGSTQTINWDVAGTTANGVNATNVDILLSTDGGLTYPITLILGTPNDGAHDIIVPDSPGTTNIIMIRGSQHIFYDISNTNFQITGGGPADIEAPSIPENLVASNITINTVDLSWNPSTDNVAINGYDIYQDDVVIATVFEPSYRVKELMQNTSYIFKIKAKDVAGNESDFSNSVTVMTLIDTSIDSQAPSTPANLIATNPSMTTINLSWEPSIDNIGVTGYDIYQGDIIIATTETTPYTVTGLTPETTYTFRIKAKDVIGNESDFSNSATETTLPNCYEITLSLIVDQYPEEISWQLTNTANDIIASSDTSLTYSQCLEDGTYTFTILDTYGDGLCCNYGDGSYTLTANPGNIKFADGQEFGDSEITTFTINNSATEKIVVNEFITTVFSETILISPNPLSGLNSVLSINGPSSNISIIVFDFSGRMVYQENNVKNESINLQPLSSGSYFIKVISGTKTPNQTTESVHKLIIK